MPSKKKKTIQLILNHTTGVITVKPIGFTGKSCVEATKSIEEELGMSGAARKYTPDMYKKSTAVERSKQSAR